MKPSLFLVGLALIVTALNAMKPIAGDDQIYFDFVVHIAQHPLDPFGFMLFGWLPAFQELAPPGLLYWLAGAMHMMGPDERLLKLSLFPFALLLMHAVCRLARRFAPGLELPVTAMTTLSPAFLPSWNLMLDLPALALTTTAVLVFLDAAAASSRRQALMRAAGAGLIAGIAMQCKYTAFIAPAVFLLRGFIDRRLGLAAFAATLGVAVFAAVEGAIAIRYGQSHFLLHGLARTGNPLGKFTLVFPLVGILGGVAAWLLMLQTAATSRNGRSIAGAAALVLAAFGLVAMLPDYPLLGVPPATIIGGGVGLAITVMSLVVLTRLWQSGASAQERSDDLFLMGWLALEIAAYFALSPFPAVRRVLGIVLVGAVINARLLQRAWPAVAFRRATAVAAVSAIMGAAFALVDYREAAAREALANQVVAWIRERDAEHRIWVVSYGGFVHYGRKAGMRFVLGGTLEPDEWVAEDDLFVSENRLSQASNLRLITRLTIADGLPLRTYPEFHIGGTPLQRLTGPRAYANIYRVIGHRLSEGPQGPPKSDAALASPPAPVP